MRRELRTLLAIVGVGLTAALLTWRVTEPGLGWLATDALLVGAIVFGLARGRPGSAGWLLAAASLWLAGVTVWYASDWALVTALPGSTLALLALALALAAAKRLEAGGVTSLPSATFDAVRTLPTGVVDAVRLPASAAGADARSGVMSVLWGALLGAPIACVLAALLSADAGFRSALLHMVRRSGDGMELALWTFCATTGVLVGYAVLGRIQTPGTQGGAKTPHDTPRPYRAVGDAPLHVAVDARSAGPRVRPLTWLVALTQMLFLFGVYVLANRRTLFAGHDYLRALGTETYSGYLHTGFTEVSIATLLAVASVVGGHWLLTPRGGETRVGGGRGLIAVELALLTLVGVTLASCVHRLALYGEAYGYTYLRLGVGVLQLGIGGLLCLTAARCVARAGRAWGPAVAWSSVLFAVLTGSIDADGLIARRNVASARAGVPLDAEYLASLSEDARDVLPEVALIDPEIASRLAGAWLGSAADRRHDGWRARRGLGSR